MRCKDYKEVFFESDETVIKMQTAYNNQPSMATMAQPNEQFENVHLGVLYFQSRLQYNILKKF